MEKVLSSLATKRGIAESFTDIWGKTSQTSLEAKKHILSAMGYPVEDDSLMISIEKKEVVSDALRGSRTIYSAREHDHLTVEFCLSEQYSDNDELKFLFILENGQSQELLFNLGDCEITNKINLDNHFFTYFKFSYNHDLPLGYHQVFLFKKNGQTIFNATLIIAPSVCYLPEFIQKQEKIWGPSIQLYAVRSERNWGVGDFSDLKSLLRLVASWGGDFVGLNPIHALYPANPASCSPYSPSSRRWLNVIYIDVEAIPEFSQFKQIKEEFESDGVESQLQSLRDLDWVDYETVFPLKLKWLRKIYDATDLRDSSQNGQTFRQFIEAGGDSLLQIAAYDAMQATFYAGGMHAWGPQVWPKAYREFTSETVQDWIKRHPNEIRFYQYLQWIAQEQLSQAEALAKALGMKIGIYRDLAVGVSEGAADVWANPQRYCVKASIGAPPDPLGPQGQNWGLPPINPTRWKEEGYQSFIELLRRNMSQGGALRIDHVMGLFRLWWVPPGQSATAGAYVQYPYEDLFSILALESVRNRCMVIGEDLGTVPDEIRTLLKTNGVFSYKVYFFERAADGGYFSPAHYPYQSMSALTTHDMPTLRGYWHCDDLSLGRELGLYPDEEKLQALYRERHESKQAILDSTRWHGVLAADIGSDVSWVGMNSALSHTLQEHMCKGASALFSTQLEDWLEMDQPVNVPGTSTEYPNWRRKLSKTLEAMTSMESLKQLASVMTAGRKAPYKS